MKLFFLFSLLGTFMLADETQRLEAILKNTQELRLKFQHSQKSLQICKAELHSKGDTSQKIEELEKKIEKLNSIIQQKDQEILKLKSGAATQKTKIVAVAKKPSYTPQTKPTTYRLNDISNIYNNQNGEKVIGVWGEGTSFTSNYKTQHWIKITGYFFEGRWIPARDKQMWVRISKAVARD